MRTFSWTWFLLLLTALYAGWYISSDYATLVQWYRGLYPAFYKGNVWEQTFFTPEVKRVGDYWCMAAVVLSVFLVLGRKFISFPTVPKGWIRQLWIPGWLFPVALAVVLWGIAQEQLSYATDEVFSAVQFAAIHPFQTISYYALPNNHPLFNLFNKTFFFFIQDRVLTGRILSLLCFAGILLGLWHYLVRWIHNPWLRMVLLLAFAVQFPVWGFSTQARGYELVLLLGWLSYWTLDTYQRDRQAFWLVLHGMCNIAGFFTVPSYLFWWIGVSLAPLWGMLQELRVDTRYLRMLLVSGACALIDGLPLLTFSGIGAIAENRYVKAGNTTAWDFFIHLNSQNYFNGLFAEWFGISAETAWPGVILLLVPLMSVFFIKKAPSGFKTLIATYISLLLVFILMAVVMRRLPFYRNMLGHGHLVLFCILLSVYFWLREAPLRARQAMAGLLLLWAMAVAWRSYQNMPERLYYYPINGYARHFEDCPVDFKPGSTVYVDGECYYWAAFFSQKRAHLHLKTALNPAAFNQQDYCIMPKGVAPPGKDGAYELIAEWDEYVVLRFRGSGGSGVPGRSFNGQ